MNIYDTSQTVFHHQEFFSDPLQLALHEKRVDQEQDGHNQGWDVFINCLPFRYRIHVWIIYYTWTVQLAHMQGEM